MKNQLEHKIAEAFAQKDKATGFEGKDALWNRLMLAQPGTTSAFILWKVAAVFMGILLAGSLIAGFTIQKNYTQKLNSQLEQNQMLILRIDSLIKLTPKVITKTEFIETKISDSNEENLKNKVDKLTQTNIQLSRENLFLQNKIREKEILFLAEKDSMKNILARLLSSQNQSVAQPDENNQIEQEQFRLKPSQNKPSYNETEEITQPKIQLILFKNTLNNKKIDSGSTLFSK